MRERYSIERTEDFVSRLIAFIDRQEKGMCFTGSGWKKDAEVLAGFGEYRSFNGEHITEAPSYFKEIKDYIFCHLNYEVKDQLERLGSKGSNTCGFPLFTLFVPAIVVKVKEGSVEFWFHPEHFSKKEIASIAEEIKSALPNPVGLQGGDGFHHMGSEAYNSDLRRLKQHIQRGDVYQANYCQEFFWENIAVNASALFEQGTQQMANPFSVFYRNGEHALLSFSPERFLRFESGNVISQPMKGTSPRDRDPAMDERLREVLRTSEKDRRENVMIVDLVRNDLSHYAEPGSVKVPELYRIETYPRVHQMFSTVTAKLREGVHPLEALLKAFPMGSMTGAPKVRAMQILERLERSQRGIYSGTVGYLTPEGDGDFNVIIRSFVYNERTSILSCHAGGGITDLSDTEAEYEESLVKVRPLLELVFGHFEDPPPSLPLIRATATT